MEGGNEASATSGITQFAEGEQKRWMCACPNDEAENLPRMDSALGVQLDGGAVKKKAEASKNIRTQNARPNNWIAAVSAAKESSRKVRKVRKKN